MISIPIVILAIKVTFAITLTHIGLKLLLSHSENKLRFILNNIDMDEGFEECRRLIQTEFEHNDIGPMKAFALMVSLVSKILSIVGFVITIALYLWLVIQ